MASKSEMLQEPISTLMNLDKLALPLFLVERHAILTKKRNS